MKRHFVTLFDASHLRRTVFLFIISAALIITSSIVGISDNWPMIAMFLAGIIFLFFVVLHPWQEPVRYVILALVCIGILLLEWLVITLLVKIDKTEYISEGIGMGIAFLFCVPGILVGIIGSILCALRKK